MNHQTKNKEAPGSAHGGLGEELPLQVSTSQAHPSSTWTRSELERRALVEAGGVAVCTLRRGKDESLRQWSIAEGRFLRIDRQTRWGNPFKIQDSRPGNDRDAVCVTYWDYLRSTPSLLAQLPDLRGKLLACWCHPKRCHGHELIRMLVLRKMIPDQPLPPLARDDRPRPTQRELLQEVRRAIRKAGGRVLCWENGRILFATKGAVHE